MPATIKQHKESHFVHSTEVGLRRGFVFSKQEANIMPLELKMISLDWMYCVCLIPLLLEFMPFKA